jgi:hypothetical protein
MDPVVQAEGHFELLERDSGNRLVIRSEGDLHLLVPIETAILAGHVLGDLAIKGVQGTIHVAEISGDAVLQNLSQIMLGKVQGDLSVKNIDGHLEVTVVYGDVLVRNIEGDAILDSIYGDAAVYYVNGNISLAQCMGDINLRTVNGEVLIKSGRRDANLRNIGGICSIEDIHGDVRLQGGLSRGEHTFMAAGDIVFRWPINAPLQLGAKASAISNRLPLEDMTEAEGTLVGRIGDGDTVVSLTAGGRISLKEDQIIHEKWRQENQEAFDMDFMTDFSDLGARISAEVGESVANLAKEVEKSFGPEFAEKMSAKVTKQAEKAAQKAEAAAEKAQKYAEREAARSKKYQRRPTDPPTPRSTVKPDTSARKASSDEHLKILRMVENGTISPDEAATLLKALEQ